MKKFILGLLVFVAGTALADISSRLNIRSQDGTVNTYPYQARFTNGSVTDNNDGTVSISASGGSSLPLPAGATNYVQITTGAIAQSGAFYTSSGTATNFNAANIKFSANTNMLSWTDGSSFLSMPDAFTTYFGFQSGIIRNGDSFNTGIGADAMPFINSGTFNTCVGAFCMSANLITGQQNNSIGYASLADVTAGSFNNAMGGSSLHDLTTGSNNTAVGTIALAHTNGSNNVGLGFQADYQNLTQPANVMIGYNVGVGTTALVNYDVNGSSNTWVGFEAGQGVSSNTAISNSIAIGNQALVTASNTAQIGGTLGSGNEVMLLATSATVNQMTINGLSASLPVQTNSSKVLTSAAIDLSGSQATGALAAGRFPALTGDITTSAGSLATTAAATQANITKITSALTLGAAGNSVTISSNEVLPGATFYQGIGPSFNLPLAMGANKITGLANGTAATDAAAFGQIYYGFQAPIQSSNTTSTTASGTAYTVTNLAATITPTASAHRIKITVTGNFQNNNQVTTNVFVSVFRGSSDLSNGSGFVSQGGGAALSIVVPASFSYIDSPATTSATTYTVEIKSSAAAAGVWNVMTGTCVIILEEII